MNEDSDGRNDYLMIDENTQHELAQDLERKHLGLNVMTTKPGRDLRLIGRLESFKLIAVDAEPGSEGEVGVARIVVAGIKVTVARDHKIYFVDGTDNSPVYAKPALPRGSK
ncbi:hypothetical protein [Paenarthrobacter ilicis]|uniref:hypothetical protein n=1 Tax=Paenarthrobacter ilicis TaxID=43665 RepID=UPI0028D43189|nr:hypothetical protein [Paenarthrobacter ilicis]